MPGSHLATRRLYSRPMSQGDLALLLRLNKSWHDGISAENLYDFTRAWWVMSLANAQRVARVLAVAGGIVREVYQPTQWLPSPVEGLENRIGFEGVVACDRETYVGRDVTHLFRHGSANPVRYLPLDALIDDAVIAPTPAPRIPAARAEQLPDGAVEPGLLERIVPQAATRSCWSGTAPAPPGTVPTAGRSRKHQGGARQEPRSEIAPAQDQHRNRLTAHGKIDRSCKSQAARFGKATGTGTLPLTPRSQSPSGAARTLPPI